MNSFNYIIKKWQSAPSEKRFDIIVKNIKPLYRNIELISLMNSLMDNITSFSEREYYLILLKKTVLQIQRRPDQEHFKAFEDEYLQEAEQIAQEQLEHDPVKWIEAELEFVRLGKDLNLTETLIPSTQSQIKMPVNPKKEWLTFPEVMGIFHLSKASLRKRIAEGMPVSKLGARLLFNQNLVYDWVIKGDD